MPAHRSAGRIVVRRACGRGAPRPARRPARRRRGAGRVFAHLPACPGQGPGRADAPRSLEPSWTGRDVRCPGADVPAVFRCADRV